MHNSKKLAEMLVTRFKQSKVAQVEGYNRFVFLRVTDTAVIIRREKGTEARVPFEKIEAAITAVQEDHSVYSGGPEALRSHGITHINSPLWAILHLATLEEIIG